MNFYKNLPDDYADYSKKNFQRTLLSHLGKAGYIDKSLAMEIAIDSFFIAFEEWDTQGKEE